MANDFEQVARVWVAARPQHAHEALRRTLRAATQFFETDCRVDVIAQDRLSGVEVAGEEALDTFPQELLAVLSIPHDTCLHRFLELSRQRHLTSPEAFASCSLPTALAQSRCH